MRAAGMEPKQDKKPKLTAEDVFGRSIEQVITENASRAPSAPLVKSAHYKSVLYIGDAHFPFVDQGMLCLIYEYVERFKPEVIVQQGDLFDAFAQSKFPRSLNIYNPFEELKLARQMSASMWESLRKLAPKAELHQIMGNHDIRPLKRIIEKAPDCEPFMDLKPHYTFDGVKTHHDYREVLKINDTNIHHGWLSQLGAHRDYFHGNAAVAHTHRGGVVFKRIGDRILWELNSGFIADAHSKVLGYTPSRISHSTVGFGTEDALGPRFVPG